MRQILLSIATLFMATAVGAQQSAIPAPKRAQQVLVYQFPEIFRHFAPERLDMSETANSMLRYLLMQNRYYDFEFEFSNSGISSQSPAFSHHLYTDSLEYSCSLIPLEDAEQFKKLIGILPGQQAEDFSGGKLHSLEFGSIAYIPNNQSYAILMGYSGSYKAFNDESRAERWGVSKLWPYSDEETAWPIEVSADSVVALEPPAEALIAADDVVAVAVDVTPVEGEQVSDDDMSRVSVEVEDIYAVREKEIDSVCQIWMRQLLESMLKESKDSYARLREWKDIKFPPANALVTGYFDFKAQWLLGPDWVRSLLGVDDIPSASEEWMQFSLLNEPHAVELRMESHVAPSTAKATSRIFGRKLNRKMLHYINVDKDISVGAYAINIRRYLEEVPEIFKTAYATFRDAEEIDLALDLLAIALDEKAIDKLVRGSGVFIFSDIQPKTYTAVKYNWDAENFESTEEEVTQTTSMPEFIYIFDTKDAATVRKILEYGRKREGLSYRDGIYMLDRPGSMEGMELYFTVKKNLVFMATNRKELEQIRAGKRRGKMTCAKRRFLRKHVAAGWFNSKRMAEVITIKNSDDTDLSRIAIKMNLLGPINFSYDRSRTQTQKGRIIIHTDNHDAAAIDYLLHIFEDLKFK